MKRGLFVMKKSNMEDKYYQLIEKYNVGAPRYTSYPTVPCWDVEKFSVNQWIAALKKTYDSKAVKSGMALYVHLPFVRAFAHIAAVIPELRKTIRLRVLIYVQS